MKRELFFRIVGILLLALLPGSLAAQYENQDLKIGKRQVKNVLILPPEATLLKFGMKGSESLIAEAQAMGSGLSMIVAAALEARGFHVIEDPSTTSALGANQDFKYALADLQASYDRLHEVIRESPEDVRKGRFSLGDQVANFNPGAAVDGLVFVRAKGILPTPGYKKFELLTGMGVSYNHASVDISIVDAQTGAILYFAKPGIGGNFIGNPDGMKPKIEHSFSQLKAR